MCKEREMSKVYIEGFKMPKSCYKCRFHKKEPILVLLTATTKSEEYCELTYNDVKGHLKTRSQDCPLKED